MSECEIAVDCRSLTQTARDLKGQDKITSSNEDFIVHALQLIYLPDQMVDSSHDRPAKHSSYVCTYIESYTQSRRDDELQRGVA